MIYYDILWYIMIYYDLLWFIMIYYDLLWYIMIYYDILWIMNHVRKNWDYHHPWTWNPVLIQLENMLRSFHGLGTVIVSAVEAAVCCTPYRFAKFGGKQFRLFFLVDSGFGTHFANSRNQETYRSYRFCFVADWYGIRVLVAFIGLAYTCMYQNREPRKASNAQFSIDDCPNGHWSGDFILPVMVPFGNLT
jgi:hypothetical protein